MKTYSPTEVEHSVFGKPGKQLPLLDERFFKQMEPASDWRQKILKIYKKCMLAVGVSGHSLFLFQAIKIITTRSAGDISIPGFCVALFSIFCWMFYGILIKDKILISVNAFGATAALTCLIAIWLL